MSFRTPLYRCLPISAAILFMAGGSFATPVSARSLSSSATAGAFTLGSASRWVTLSGSLSPDIARARRVRSLPTSEQIGISVALRVRDQPGLTRFLQQVYDPASASYRHFLTTSQFAQRFGASPASQSRVVDWLRSQGITVTGISRNALEIDGRGAVAAVDRAFATSLATYQTATRTFRANTQPIRIPGNLASDVLAVSGLSTAAQQQPASRARVGTRLTPRGNAPADIQSQYDLTSLEAQGTNGSGQTMAIVSFADYDASNVSTFDGLFGLNGNATKLKVSDGRTTGARAGVKNGQDEADADIELIHAIAPRATVLVYEAPNSSLGGINVYNKIVSDNRASVVTTSWGGAESSYSSSELNAVHQSLQEGAAQGQAFFAASGDTGAYDAFGNGTGNDTTLAVDFPASDPWVTGVGGTSLNSDGSQYSGETAWSDNSDSRSPAGSGGGLSDVFSRPSYQTGPGAQNQYSNGKRQVPDVAANADPHTGYAVYTVNPRNQPSWAVIGGTSAASPIWAGFAALLNQATGRRVGFLNPLLYALGQQTSTLPRSPYHDVTEGTNLYYPATAGWDFATGWGSFDGAALVSDVKSLPALLPAAASPSLGIKKVILLHRVNGKLQATTALKVGEQGTLIILYSSKNAGSLSITGTAFIRQNGQLLKSTQLKATTYTGQKALTAAIRFTSKKRVGLLSTQITVSLGTVSAAKSRTFKIIPPGM